MLKHLALASFYYAWISSFLFDNDFFYLLGVCKDFALYGYLGFWFLPIYLLVRVTFHSTSSNSQDAFGVDEFSNAIFIQTLLQMNTMRS